MRINIMFNDMTINEKKKKHEVQFIFNGGIRKRSFYFFP